MKNFKRVVLSIICVKAILFSTMIFANSDFRVKGIRIVGLQRVNKGTVLNYLPVHVGETVGPNSTANIIKALYKTGFFQSVVLEREQDILIVRVVERSTIGSIKVSGSDMVPKDKMKEILKDLGLVKGRVYQTQSLEMIL